MDRRIERWRQTGKETTKEDTVRGCKQVKEPKLAGTNGVRSHTYSRVRLQHTALESVGDGQLIYRGRAHFYRGAGEIKQVKHLLLREQGLLELTGAECLIMCKDAALTYAVIYSPPSFIVLH